MRVLRAGAGALGGVVATVLLLLAVVLAVTIVGLPVAALLGFAAFRLYRLSFRLLMPRPADVSKAVTREAQRHRRNLRRASKRTVNRTHRRRARWAKRIPRTRRAWWSRRRLSRR